MSVSISIILSEPRDIDSLLVLIKNHFDINYIREAIESIVVMDKDNFYIIRISSRRLKFIISSIVNEENIDIRIKTVKDFLEFNFKNETLGIFVNDEFKFHFDYMNDIDIIFC